MWLWGFNLVLGGKEKDQHEDLISAGSVMTTVICLNNGDATHTFFFEPVAKLNQ